jgi:hypothetical protein
MAIDAQTAAVVSAIAAAISAFAALLSLLVAFGAVYLQAKAGKPSVRVRVSASSLATPGIGLSTPVLDISAQNKGPVPVKIVSVGFDVDGGRTAPILDPREITGAQALPRRLEPGEAVSIVFSFPEVARIDAEAHVRGVFVSTAIGGRYTAGLKRRWMRGWARRAAVGWDHKP